VSPALHSCRTRVDRFPFWSADFSRRFSPVPPALIGHRDRKSSAAKRKGKDAKFGFGGAKNNSRSKRNDSSSFLNAAGKGDKFSVKQNKTPFAGTAGKKKKTANSRPGKSKRAGGGRR